MSAALNRLRIVREAAHSGTEGCVAAAASAVLAEVAPLAAAELASRAAVASASRSKHPRSSRISWADCVSVDETDLKGCDKTRPSAAYS